MLSLMLRHRPEEFGVEVDKYGYADVEAVLTALQERTSSITLEEIEHLVHDAEKQRFEIEEGKIRARYGHSIPIEMDREPITPPELLYKDVPVGDLDVIRSKGLLPGDRYYVHLSHQSDRGSRPLRGGKPQVVIRILAKQAHAEGVSFFDCGPTILTLEVPAKFLEIPDLPPNKPPSRIDPSPSPPESRSTQVTFGRGRRTLPRR